MTSFKPSVKGRMRYRFKKVAKIFESQLRSIARAYIERETEREWASSQRRSSVTLNERTIEYGFALRHLAEICPRTVLDVGTGKSSWPHLLAMSGYKITAIDNVKNYHSVSEYWNRHWHVINDDIISPKTSDTFDVITCISVLEHIPEHEQAISSMFGLLNNNGHLILTVPFHKDVYHSNIYKHPQAGYGTDFSFICQIFSDVELCKWLEANKGIVLHEELYEVFTGELWTFGKRLVPPRKVSRNMNHHLGCFVIKKLSAD